ncbi:hypothetical protein ES703_43682 [subsurface metagenome]
MAEYSAHTYGDDRYVRQTEKRMRQEDKRCALGDIKEYGQVARFLTARPEDVNGAGIAVSIVPGVLTQKQATDNQGKGNSPQPEGSYGQ